MPQKNGTTTDPILDELESIKRLLAFGATSIRRESGRHCRRPGCQSEQCEPNVPEADRSRKGQSDEAQRIKEGLTREPPCHCFRSPLECT